MKMEKFPTHTTIRYPTKNLKYHKNYKQNESIIGHHQHKNNISNHLTSVPCAAYNLN